MPKIRGVKPDTWTDDKFVRLSPLARLLFIGMWNYACDNGHVEDNAVQLKIRLLPMDSCDIAALIEEMVKTGQIEQHEGFLKVVKLPEHQHIDMRWLALCEWCEHDEHTTYTPDQKKPRSKSALRAPVEQSKSAPRVLDADGDGDGEGEGDGELTKPRPRKRATQLPDTFRPTEKHQSLAADLNVDLRGEWVKFCDHHRSKGSTFKDWGAALNNWIRKAAEYGNVRPLNRPTIDDQGRTILPPLPGRSPWGN